MEVVLGLKMLSAAMLPIWQDAARTLIAQQDTGEIANATDSKTSASTSRTLLWLPRIELSDYK